MTALRPISYFSAILDFEAGAAGRQEERRLIRLPVVVGQSVGQWARDQLDRQLRLGRSIPLRRTKPGLGRRYSREL